MLVEKLTEHLCNLREIHGMQIADVSQHEFLFSIVRNKIAAQLFGVCVNTIASYFERGEAETDIQRYSLEA